MLILKGCCIALQQLGRIHVAAFSDEVLHWEVANKAIFWTQPVFYGVDVTCLHTQAKHSHFEEVGSANTACQSGHNLGAKRRALHCTWTQCSSLLGGGSR